jgi:hypothetical protein
LRIAVDSAGNAYASGDTDSADFPVVAGVQPTYAGGADAFVAKLNPSGDQFVYSTYLGGTGLDGSTAIAVAPDGSVLVSGFTNSRDFRTVDPVQRSFGGGEFDAFIASFNASGTTLEYATYLGGTGLDSGFGIAVNAVGNAYLMGMTDSTDFPTASPMQRSNGGGSSDLFIARIGGGVSTGPRIDGASLRGKQLVVDGAGFESRAKILLNGVAQKTASDDQNPAARLIAKKGGKKISRGETVAIQVRNPDGTLSNELSFTRQ